MLKIGFMLGDRKIVRFEIDGKVVRYFDDMWPDGIQWYPLDHSLILKMRGNRNQDIKILAALILDANKGKDLEEYNNCKTEEDIATIIRRDCTYKGYLEIKE